MPAELESGFFYRTPAWHREGTVVDHVLTAAEAIEVAKLDWEVQTVPLYVGDLDNGLQEVPWRATMRADTGAVLGIVGQRYHPVQNVDLFEFFDQVVDPAEGAFYHTGGVLCGGRRVWLLAKVPGDFYVPGVPEDLVENYVLLASSHDGSLCVTAKFTEVRVVCQNTLNMALGRRSPVSVSIRHTRNAVEQLREAHKVLGLASKRADELAEAAERMRRTQLNAKLIQFYLTHLFPSSVEKDGRPPSKKVRRHRERVMELFEFGAANTLTGMRGTAWALFGATTEYVDHEFPTHGPTDTLNRLWFGQAEQIKAKAAAVLLGDVRP